MKIILNNIYVYIISNIMFYFKFLFNYLFNNFFNENYEIIFTFII